MPRGCPIKKIVDCVARKKNFHWIAMTRIAWGGNRWEQNSLWILRNIFLPFVRLIERYLTHSLNVINISEVRYVLRGIVIFQMQVEENDCVTFHFFLLLLDDQARDDQAWLIKLCSSCGKEEVDEEDRCWINVNTMLKKYICEDE